MSDATAAPPPPPTPTAASGEPKASGAMRALAAVVALVLLFGVAVMVIIVINPDNLPLCDDVAAGKAKLGPTLECIDSSSAVYNAQRVLAGICGVIGALAALLGFYVAATGRRGSQMAKLTGIAIAVGVVVFLMDNI